MILLCSKVLLLLWIGIQFFGSILTCNDLKHSSAVNKATIFVTFIALVLTMIVVWPR